LDLDLDLFGILSVAGRKRRAALGTNALVLGQFVGFLNHGQVAVVAPCRARPILTLASLGQRGRGLILFPFQTIGAVPGRGGFTLATKELILEFAILAPKLLDLGFE
jgi:hypothetical protein